MEMCFDKAMEEYFKYLKFKIKESTFIINERKIKKYILSYFKDNNIFELTIKDYLDWQIYIEKFGFKYNYKSSLHYCFTNFLDYCMTFYDLDKNVARKIGNFRNDDIKDVGNIWCIEEFNLFISKVDNKIYNVLFKLLYFTGLRKGEALALTFNDIDLSRNIININKTITRYYKNNKKLITTPKTKSSNRNIYIDNQLKKEIEELKEYYINNYEDFNSNFFIFGGNESIPFTTLKRKKDYYCELSNVKKIKIHEFRHSHACLLFSNDVPIEDISNRLGHSTISMTMDTYLKYLPKNEKRVISTLNRLRLT